jgi:cold-inducible RNA-binding protein
VLPSVGPTARNGPSYSEHLSSARANSLPASSRSFPCFIDARVDLGIWFCSSAKRGRSSGGVFLDGDLKPGSRERLCNWQSGITHHTVKLYVGNISFTITEADLQHIFEQFGSVTEIKVVTDRETGQPRGFAFVTMGNDAEGRAAIKSLDGKAFGGRPLKVNEARPKEDRPPRSSSRPRR